MKRSRWITLIVAAHAAAFEVVVRAEAQGCVGGHFVWTLLVGVAIGAACTVSRIAGEKDGRRA
jgi:hypothetical protein